VSQQPAPGTRVRDNGLPTVTLRLERNPDYEQRGVPENRSPQAGTRIVPPDGEATAGARATQPARPADPDPAPSAKSGGEPGREPAFRVPGAPRAPRDELPLPERARLLEKRLAGHSKPSPALLGYWRNQHAWVVTGARFGWSGGAEALRTLIRIDESLQARWGIGVRSEAAARAALAEVERRSAR
jgi:hypothetical protein